MTRVGVILSLLMVGLVAASGGKQRSSGLEQPKAFRAGYEYVFDYNGQIAIGQVAPNTQSVELMDQHPFSEDNEQKAATRIQCQSKFIFNSEHTATLRLDKIRIGQLNEQIVDAQRIQPMGVFQSKKIEESKLRQLQLPCEFRYVDGVVRSIQFHPEDKVWSKNIKRAVLNLIQVNLKQHESSLSTIEENSNQEIMNESEKFFTAKAFTVPETTLEGECLTTYTINSNSDIRYRNSRIEKYESDEDTDELQNNQQLFNVTKSIAFKQCKQIADVTFGVHPQPEAHPQCIQCMQQQWINSKQESSTEHKDFYYQNPCEQLCDPKLIKEQNLDRSTVMRFVIAGRPQQPRECTIQRAELLSQYVYKTIPFPSTKAYGNNEQRSAVGGAMRAVVVGELLFRAFSLASSTSKVQLKEDCQESACSLLYDNEAESLQKRFQMFGDAEFDRKEGPFAHVHGKVDRALNIFHRILHLSTNGKENNGFESELIAQMPRLIHTLRTCTVTELEQILTSLKQQYSQELSQWEKTKQIFVDTLAIAGTRNTIFVLVQQIRSKELSPVKAAQVLSSLTGLPSPSTAIVDLVLDVCKSGEAKKSAILRQSCLLTTGALVGDLCRFRTQKGDNNVQRLVYGQQTGFNVDNEMCPLNKKKAYKQFFVEQFENVETTYEQILALKAIGNAALDITVASPLETIIRGQDKRVAQSPLVRAQAIDALRRVAVQMPRKIQRLLLPIFQNVRELPEIRILAFSTIMSNTQLERPIIDQIVYTLSKEQNRDVQSYVYTMIKSLAKSTIISEQELAKHLKAALKLANIDDREMSRNGMSSVRVHLPLFFARNDDGIIVNLMSVLNGNKDKQTQKPMELSHFAASISSIINGQLYAENGAGVAATFSNADHWARNLLNAILIQSNEESDNFSKKMRSQRNGADNAKLADQELRDIASTLGTKKRSDENDDEEQLEYNQNRGFAMLCLRVDNVDKVVIPFADEMLPTALKALLNGRTGEKLSIAELRQYFNNEKLSSIQKTHHRFLSAMMLAEKRCFIPTALGIPLEVEQMSPVLAGLEGQIKPSFSGSSLKTQFNIQASASLSQTQKMEAVFPIVSAGVKSSRAVELHLPLNGQLELNAKEGMKVTLKTPTVGQTPTKMRLFGIHTLAATFTSDFDSKTHIFREPKIKSIHNAHYGNAESSLNNNVVRHVDVNRLVGEHAIGIPLRVNGHFYLPGVAAQRYIADYLAALWEISVTSENHLHITFEPTDDTPREIVLRAEAALFQKMSGNVAELSTQLRDFYAEQRFRSAVPMDKDEEDVFSNEYHQRNNEYFNKYLSQFDDAKVYKHFVKLSAQTNGGRKQNKAELELQSACDAKHKFCKLSTSIKRTPMLVDESELWTLKSEVEMVMPDYVSSVEHLDSLVEKKNQKFVLHTKTEWGCQRKQFIEIRTEGQNKKDKQLQKLIANIENSNEQKELEIKNKLKLETSFLNHFNVVAEYKLQPLIKTAFSRILEALKTYNFWNTESNSPVKENICQGTTCRLYANLVIDPITQRFANISIRTPTESIRIPSVQMPARVRPMPLMQAADKQTHSISQAFNRFAENIFGSPSTYGASAECKAYGNLVSTFDRVEYASPITTDCYTVLAKDCSERAANEQRPEFVVMMKSLSKDGKQKKIKVISSENIVECQALENTESAGWTTSNTTPSKKIQCTVNGDIVTPVNTVEYDSFVEYNNDEQTSVTINLVRQGVRVRFGCLCKSCDCQKAVVSYLDERFKRTSCGLCGHYDDSTTDEWRTSGDEKTDDLAIFHRSYTMRNSEECSATKLDSFYNLNKDKFRVIKDSDEEEQPMKLASKKMIKEQDDDEGIENWQQGNYVDEDDDQVSASVEVAQKYYGNVNYKNSEELSEETDDDEGFFDFAGKKERKQRANKKVIEPENQTRVIEYNHLICFSVQPVKQCPTDTIVAYKSVDEMTQYDIDNAEQEYDEARLDQEDQQKTTVKFACLSRSSSIARRMQHQAKRGVIVDVSGYSPNSVEQVIEPKSCIKINF